MSSVTSCSTVGTPKTFSCDVEDSRGARGFHCLWFWDDIMETVKMDTLSSYRRVLFGVSLCAKDICHWKSFRTNYLQVHKVCN